MLGLSLGNTEFQLPPSIVFRSGDWLGHSRTLKCFLQSHSLDALAVCLVSLSCWKTQPRPIFSALTEGRRLLAKILRNMGPIHTVQSSCPLCRKAPTKHDVSTPMLHGWDGVLGIVLILLLHPNTVYTKKLYFGLIWPHDLLPCLLWIIQMSLANFRRAWTCAGLSRGTLHVLQDFNPWRCSVLLMVTVEIVVPALFRSLTRSSRVVLGWSLTFFRIIDTPRGEILHGAPVWGRLTVILNFFNFLIIAPTVVAISPSCLSIVL